MLMLEEYLTRIPTWILLIICTFLIRYWIKSVKDSINKLYNKVDYIGDQTESIHGGLTDSLNGHYAEGYKKGYERTMEAKEHERVRLEKDRPNKLFF